MSVTMQEMINFHLTGKAGRDDSAKSVGGDACPALMVPYRQLSDLRYDFPLVLIDNCDDRLFAESLTGIMNRLMRDIAPQGNSGEQLRQHMLRLEARIRDLVASGYELSLSQLWRRAEQSLISECAGDEADTLRNSLATARFALKTDGRVIDCDERVAERVLQHAFIVTKGRRTRKTAEKIERLVIRLRNMLKVDDLKNSSSRTPEKLKKNLGKRYKESFDFELMSNLLDDVTPKNRLPSARRKRIKDALAELESQRFFVSAETGLNRSGQGQYPFSFESLRTALKAYEERLSGMTELLKAISIAELECDNAYRESTHAPYFERFSAEAVTSEDVALFPPYMICINESDLTTRDSARLLDLAAAELPMKVLIEVSDPLDNRLTQITSAPGPEFILQTATSNLYRHCREIRRGLEYPGPAIFSVFTPGEHEYSERPSYLTAAAAVDSRAFPVFSYDPSAGPGLADRFIIDGNPDVGTDWPVREFSYQDEELQTVTQDYAFTVADFAALLQKYSEHFVLVPAASWSDAMLPVADYMQLHDSECVDKVPFVAIVDHDDVLQRFIVDDQLIRLARRCRERWHALQELGGVNNSYVSEALKGAVPVSKETGQAEAFSDEDFPEPLEDNTQSSSEVLDDEQEPPSIGTDEAFIDTLLCTTCDECTTKNDRMFAYDENKQAYIKDAGAGTYRDMVEAAEACQVSIIHPGQPLNPDEPGLEDLKARAAAFIV